MNHFNTDQLRDYRFGLLEAPETAKIAAHLETCDACRAELDAIERQFAALDLLKDQPAVSDQVVAAVLRAKPVRKVHPFRTAAILAAAASIAILLGIFHFGQKTAVPIAERTARRAVPTEPTLAELRAEQPFAPASNIELNVLPRRDDVQLTIYNAEDLTLVRETRKLTLKRGWNWLQFMWSNTLIDPTSLSLEPKTHADQIEITQLVYPPRLSELARWTIFSEFSGEAEFELTYFTSGLKWNAFYEATLSPDEQSMQLKSYVRVDNGSGEDYEEAQTRLVVGEINLQEKIATLAKRKWPYNRAMPEIRLPELKGQGEGLLETDKNERILRLETGNLRLGYDADFYFEEKEILKQALSEYQLYTIEGRETIPDGWGKRLPSFDVQEIGVTNLYKYDEERWGSDTMRFLSFANTEACQLGETPLPHGYVRVFGNIVPGASSSAIQRTGAGSSGYPLRYIGAAGIKYIPVGEEVELELGAAQKVKIEPKLMRTRTDNYEFHQTSMGDDVEAMDDLFGEHWRKGDISGWDEITNWKIEITNTRDLPVVVEITRATGSNDWEIRTDDDFEKYDADHIRFTVHLEPRSKREIHYELTVKREE